MWLPWLEKKKKRSLNIHALDQEEGLGADALEAAGRVRRVGGRPHTLIRI